MLTIVVPMAGRGSRFAQVGYTLPKPLIPVHGAPMIRLVIDNIRPSTPHRFVFVCQREHLEFALWYLKGKGYVKRGDNGRFTLTIPGSDQVESFGKTGENRNLKLLEPASSVEE